MTATTNHGDSRADSQAASRPACRFWDEPSAAGLIVSFLIAALVLIGCSDSDDDVASICADAGYAGQALQACEAYCGAGCAQSADGACAAARVDFHAATGEVVLPCDCSRAQADETAFLEQHPPPTPEPFVRTVLEVPAGVDPDSPQHPIFHPDGEHLIWVGSLSDEAGLHLMISRVDGSDSQCLTCALGGLPFAKPDVFPDGQRVIVGNQSPLGTNVPLPFTSPFPDAETVPILECSPSLLDCQEAELVFVRVPYDPDDAALFTNQRVREFRVAPDGVHIAWTQGRSAVPLTLIPVIAELRRESDHYELDDVEVLITLEPALRERADGSFDFELPISGEIKRFAEGGTSIALFHPENAFNGDPTLLDLATAERRRLTRHPDYDEPIDLSADGRWMVVGSKRSADPAFDVLAAFGLIARPAFTELAGSVLYSGWAFAGNSNRNRGLDAWLLDRHGARAGYIGQQLSDDVCYGGFERQHWDSAGTRIVKREQIRPVMVDAAECAGLPARRIVTYDLLSRAPIPEGDRIPAARTPDVPWAVGIEDVKHAAALQAGRYVVPGRIFGQAAVDLSSVGTAISIEYTDFSDDGISVLNGTESLAVQADGVPYTAAIDVSGCRAGFLQSSATLQGASLTAVFGTLGGEIASQLGDESYELCAPGLPGIDSCR